MSDKNTDAAAPAAPAAKGGGMLPLIAIIVLVPALCFGTTQFLLIPALKKAAGNTGETASAESGGKKTESKKEGDKKGKKDGAPAHSCDFAGVIVNLANSKGTRYLRTSFTLAGDDENIETLVKANETKLKDVAIGILSAQTLDSLEQPGARAAIRNQLIEQFNQALHGEVVQQLFFSEFVVQ